MPSHYTSHSAKRKVRYNPENIILMVVNYMRKPDHLLYMI